MAALGHRECCESATLSSRAAVGPATSISSATCQDTIKKKCPCFTLTFGTSGLVTSSGEEALPAAGPTGTAVRIPESVS